MVDGSPPGANPPSKTAAIRPPSILFTFVGSIVHGFGGGVGFTLVICMMAGIRERLDMARVPVAMQGIPVSFVVGCLMALSFLGFQGLFAG